MNEIYLFITTDGIAESFADYKKAEERFESEFRALEFAYINGEAKEVMRLENVVTWIEPFNGTVHTAVIRTLFPGRIVWYDGEQGVIRRIENEKSIVLGMENGCVITINPEEIEY